MNIRIPFTYQADCIPKGCRKLRRVVVRDWVTVDLMTCSDATAPVAMAYADRHIGAGRWLPIRVTGGYQFWHIVGRELPLEAAVLREFADFDQGDAQSIVRAEELRLRHSKWDDRSERISSIRLRISGYVAVENQLYALRPELRYVVGYRHDGESPRLGVWVATSYRDGPDFYFRADQLAAAMSCARAWAARDGASAPDEPDQEVDVIDPQFLSLDPESDLGEEYVSRLTQILTYNTSSSLAPLPPGVLDLRW